MTSQRQDSSCPACGHEALPWLTTCARCDQPLVGGATTAPATTTLTGRQGGPEWVDVPIAADQPAEVALLCHFFAEHGVLPQATRRFVSVPADDAVGLVPEIQIWAFDHDLPEDDRHSDSLAATQGRVGKVLLEAIATATGLAISTSRIPSTHEVPEPAGVASWSNRATEPVDLRSID